MNKPVKRRAITLEDLTNEFIIEKRIEGIDGQEYINCVYKLLSDTEVDIFNIAKSDINKWITIMQNRNNKPATINHYLGHARVFLYWLMAHEYIPSFKISLMKYQEEEIKFFTDEEIEILLQKPKHNCSYYEYRTWASICFILSTGARASTVVNIKIDDIDFNDKEIAYKHLKNKKIFYAPMNQNLEKVIKELINSWCIKSEYLFSDGNGNQLTVSALRQALERYCKKHGVIPRGPHALRHSFARTWVKQGGNAFALQKMLTHATLDITKKYVRLFDNEIKDDVEAYTVKF